jgi:hypothetical protein
MSCESSSSVWDIKRAIAMCKWAAPSPAFSSRGIKDLYIYINISISSKL